LNERSVARDDVCCAKGAEAQPTDDAECRAEGSFIHQTRGARPESPFCLKTRSEFDGAGPLHAKLLEPADESGLSSAQVLECGEEERKREALYFDQRLSGLKNGDALRHLEEHDTRLKPHVVPVTTLAARPVRTSLRDVSHGALGLECLESGLPQDADGDLDGLRALRTSRLLHGWPFGERGPSFPRL
jgi:hypothetical protein